MGLFSKKPQMPDYDAADCETKKKRMREIFNEAVENGNEYEILYCSMTSSKFERGFFINTNTTSFFYYIAGYRQSDFSLVLVQIDSELKEHSEACYIDMDKMVNVSYNPKYYQLCFQYQKGYGAYAELLDIKGSSRKTVYGPKNIYQPEEIEKFLDFAEAFRDKLAQKGCKLEKWKRK